MKTTYTVQFTKYTKIYFAKLNLQGLTIDSTLREVLNKDTLKRIVFFRYVENEETITRLLWLKLHEPYFVKERKPVYDYFGKKDEPIIEPSILVNE